MTTVWDLRMNKSLFIIITTEHSEASQFAMQCSNLKFNERLFEKSHSSRGLNVSIPIEFVK